MRKSTVAVCVLLILALPASATVRYVPSRYPTIQAAVDAAQAARLRLANWLPSTFPSIHFLTVFRRWDILTTGIFAAGPVEVP